MAAPSLKWDASDVALKVTTASGGVVTMSFPDRASDVAFNMPLTALTNPMTTAGDIIQGTTDGVPQRLAIGTNGQVLQSNGTTATWATVSYMENPMTTAGDIVVGGTSGAPARLAKGTDTQVLTMVSGGVAWADATGGTGGFENPMTAVGDLILGGTAGAATRLAIGTSGKVLTSNGTTATWEAPVTGFSNPMTTLGDIITGNTGGTAKRVGVGSEGQILKVVSGEPAWAAESNAVSYSTSEVALGATWIGGQALYRKVVDVGAMPNYTTKKVAHGVTGIVPVRVYGFAKDSGNVAIMLPYVSNTTTQIIKVFVDSTDVNLDTSFNWSSFSGYVIIEYYKV